VKSLNEPKKLIESPHVSVAFENLSKNSRQNYLATLRQFLKFLNSREDLTKEITVDDVVTEAKTNIKETQEKIDQFYPWLQGKKVQGYSQREKGMRESSANQLAYGYLRGFFSNLDMPLEKRWAKRIPKVKHVKQAIKNDNLYTFYDVDEKTKTIQFNRELMQEFLANLKLRDVAITLAMLSSSQDSGDLLNLNVGDIREQKDKNRIFWEGTRNKTGVPFRTFLSKEATRFVRKYLEQERANAKPTDPLFVFTRNEKEKRVTPGNLASVHREVARKMGIKWENGDYNPLRPKRMRHLFRTACDTAGIPELYINAYMGHRNHMGQEYSELSKAKIELEYLRVEPFLTVYGQSEESLEIKEDIRKMETRVVDLNREITEQKIKNMQLEAKIGSMYEFVHRNFDPLLTFVDAISELPEFETLKQKMVEAKYAKKEDDKEPPEVKVAPTKIKEAKEAFRNAKEEMEEEQ